MDEKTIEKLRLLKDELQELYYWIYNKPVEHANNFNHDLKEEMKKCILRIDEIQEELGGYLIEAIGINNANVSIDNVFISEEDYQFIKSLSRFDMSMLLSEINEFGWQKSKVTFLAMKKALNNIKNAESKN
jgi:hypothetical protein